MGPENAQAKSMVSMVFISAKKGTIYMYIATLLYVNHFSIAF